MTKSEQLIDILESLEQGEINVDIAAGAIMATVSEGMTDVRKPRPLNTLVSRFNLMPKQEEYFEAIEWLYSDMMTTGKTYLIASVIIKKAIKHPGRRVKIIDHTDLVGSGNVGSQQYLRKLIMGLIDEKLPEMKDDFKISRVHNALIYNKN